MHWNLGRIYLHLKSNTKLTTLPTLCDTGKLEYWQPKAMLVLFSMFLSFCVYSVEIYSITCRKFEFLYINI